MEFKNIKNMFAPEIKEFELSEKELEYISMLSSGVDKKKVMKLLEMSYAKIRDFYSKLGLTDKKMKRDVQAATLMASNNLIKNDVLLNLYKKYDLIECKELAELTVKV